VTVGSRSPATAPPRRHAARQSATGLLSRRRFVVPRFMEGVSRVNSDRLPFACRLRLTKLLASKTYRYSNQMSCSSDDGSVRRRRQPHLRLAVWRLRPERSVPAWRPRRLRHVHHRRDRDVRGWFITESTGNARFLPGKFVFMRIALNDGGTGTTVVTRSPPATPCGSST
jgi:hypothetical protein